MCTVRTSRKYRTSLRNVVNNNIDTVAVSSSEAETEDSLTHCNRIHLTIVITFNLSLPLLPFAFHGIWLYTEMVKSPGGVNESQRLRSQSSTSRLDPPKTIALESKTTRPPASRFQRQRPQTAVSEENEEIIENPNDKLLLCNESDFCQQLLSDGYVQSFVDFYHLTRRADPHSAEHAVSSTVSELIFIRDNLVIAETSRRLGNTLNVYAAYGRLADLYARILDWRTSIFFHEKCLEVSQLTADARAEMNANHSLGIVYQKMMDYETAQKYHEKHEEVAKLYDVVEEIAKANIELYGVYTVLARRLEAEGNSMEALHIYEICLESAKKSFNKKAEGEANGKIGTLLLSLGGASNVAKSVIYFQEQCHIAQEMGNLEEKCNACSGLALAYDLLGQGEKALVQLSTVHFISEQTGDSILQSKACRALGTLYSKVGKLELALESLKKHYHLVNVAFLNDGNPQSSGKSVTSVGSGTGAGVVSKIQGEITAARPLGSGPSDRVTVQDLDLARSFVGIAKGNLLMGNYLISIHSDLSAVLDWKLTRSELPGPESSDIRNRRLKAAPLDDDIAPDTSESDEIK